jgi:hypothetical protein
MLNAERENIFAELVAFVSKQVGRDDLSITKDTSIEDDLGVTGGDANDLIIAFGKKYNVDITNFFFEKYFNDEPGVFGFRNRSIYPFTIGHLEKAIMAGRLDEEVINS